MKTINMYYLQAGVESKNIVSLSVALRKKWSCLDGNPRFAKLTHSAKTHPTLPLIGYYSFAVVGLGMRSEMVRVTVKNMTRV